MKIKKTTTTTTKTKQKQKKNKQKNNVVPVQKKVDKQCLKIYRSNSFLPICGQILERLIFNEMFRFFFENNLIFPNQFGFKPGDSCINQLLSIIHKISNYFDDGFEVKRVFLIPQMCFIKFDTRVFSSD